LGESNFLTVVKVNFSCYATGRVGFHIGIIRYAIPCRIGKVYLPVPGQWAVNLKGATPGTVYRGSRAIANPYRDENHVHASLGLPPCSDEHFKVSTA